MSDKITEEIDIFKEKVKRDAEELVLKRFARKILDIDILSNLDKFSPNSAPKTVEINIPIPEPKDKFKRNKKSSNDGKVHKKQNLETDKDLVEENSELIITKPFLFANGSVPCNPLFIEMIDILKPRMIELVEDILLLKLAVSLMVPKIEDGNNFGVEIQQETIEAMISAESEILNHFDKFETYYETRGDLLVKIAKYPHNQDFRIAILEIDQKFHLSLCLILTDIRNLYVSLHDLVTKNIKKIKEPRTQDNKDFLY